MGTTSKPPVGATVRFRGAEYVIVRYPTHNLDVLADVAMARKPGGSRATRILLSESEVVR